MLFYLSRRGVYAKGGSDIYTLVITVDSNLSVINLVGYNTEGICLWEPKQIIHISIEKYSFWLCLS